MKSLLLKSEKKILKNFFGRKFARRFFTQLKKKNLILYNICLLKDKLYKDITLVPNQSIWFRIYKPKFQLAFILINHQDFFEIHHFTTWYGTPGTMFSKDVSKLISFLQEANQKCA